MLKYHYILYLYVLFLCCDIINFCGFALIVQSMHYIIMCVCVKNIEI